MFQLLSMLSAFVMIPAWIVIMNAAHAGGMPPSDIQLYFLLLPFIAILIANAATGYIQDELMDKSEASGIVVHEFKPGQKLLKVVYAFLHVVFGASGAAVISVAFFSLMLK